MNYLVSDTELTSIANAIRTKGETTDPLVFPAGFVSAVEDIPTGGGGGDERLYILAMAPYTNTGVSVNNDGVVAKVAYYDANIIPGAVITFYTYSDYILDTVTGQTSGSTIPYTTVTRGTYTFTMPNESVECSLLYDD